MRVPLVSTRAVCKVGVHEASGLFLYTKYQNTGYICSIGHKAIYCFCESFLSRTVLPVVSIFPNTSARKYARAISRLCLLNLTMPPSEKQTREGSHRSKEIAHTTPSRQNEVRSRVPENLGFLWSIDAVELIRDVKPRYKPVCDTKDNDACSYWFPPNKKRHFKKTKGCLYQWKMGRSTQIQKDDSLSKLKRYSVASVFFQERQDNFLVAAMDCTVDDVKKAELGWCQIRFYHKPGDLSEVGIAATYDGLAASAIGSSWMPQVLPEVYNRHMRDPKLPKKPVGTGGLCGNLSILFGMAAFSAPVEKAEEAITHSFSLGKWIRHSFAEDGDCRMSSLTVP
jgi:hypothetical protein